MKDQQKLISVNGRVITLTLIIIVIFVAMSIIKGELFYAKSNIQAIFSNLSYDLLLACGMTFVLILGGIDLSVGSILAFVGVIVTLQLQKGMAVPLAILIGLSSSIALGALNGVLVAKFNIAPFIATLGTMSILRGICYVLTSGYFIANLPVAYTRIARGSMAGIPNKIVISLTIMAVLAVLSTRIRGFKQMYYVGGNAQAAFLSGIPVVKTTLLGYVISGLMAGIAAILMTSTLGMGQAGFGLSFETKAIAAAVIGGANMHGGEGSFLGTALGVILVALVNNVFIMFNGSPNWSVGISGIILLLAAAVDIIRVKSQTRSEARK